MPSNTAAWFVKQKSRLEILTAPYISPREHEIVVKNHAVAINPVDWITQCTGRLLFSWIKYPCVLGSDLAGEVVEVGSNVTRFKVGDRVLGHALGADKSRNSAAEGAFQQYTVVLDHMAAEIPSTMAYESASVLPLGLSTAACGLFQKDHLALQYPSQTPKATGETLLVWGGSTSVGSNAIQLAVAAGYEVITTSSPDNFEYVKKLGATEAFDYRSKTVVKDLIAAFQGKTLAGALAVGSTSAEACLDVVHACKGRKFVSMASFPLSFQQVAKGASLGSELLRQAPKLVVFSAKMWFRSRVRHIRAKSIFGTTLASNEVSRVIYVDFLGEALAEGRYVAAPEALLVGQGLASIQKGLDVQVEGVSARKVVVSL